jgi:hypothetical protein
MVDVAFGSFSTKLGYLSNVRFPLDSDQTADIPVGPFSATNCDIEDGRRWREKPTEGAGRRHVLMPTHLPPGSNPLIEFYIEPLVLPD